MQRQGVRLEMHFPGQFGGPPLPGGVVAEDAKDLQLVNGIDVGVQEALDIFRDGPHAHHSPRGVQSFPPDCHGHGIIPSGRRPGHSSARRSLGFERAARREAGSALLLRETAPGPESGHVIDKNLALLRPLGIEAVGLREFPLPLSAEAVARADAGLRGLPGDGFVVLNPGGGWTSKLWL